MKHLELLLVRHTYDLDYTEGELFNENEKIRLCDTLEDRYREPGKKVYGKTAIQPGRYKIEVTFSPSFKKRMVLLHDVPEFTGIRMHWGRTADNSQGCILVGERQVPGQLENIGMTDKLTGLLDAYNNKGFITIK